jgi:hypothetical protein
MSRWGVDIGQQLQGPELTRYNIGSIWKPTEQDKVALKIVRMFDRGLDYLLTHCGTPEQVGRMLYLVKEKSDQADSVFSSCGASTTATNSHFREFQEVSP